MTGYQDFVNIFSNGKFVRSREITKKFSFQKALSSVYIIPTFFRGIYYIPTHRERKGHFIENKKDFFTNLFHSRYGQKKWYWALSTSARYYGLEWSATTILEIVTLEKSKTINISEKIRSLEKKKSYRSALLVQYLSSLEVNIIYIHKGNQDSFSSIQIDETIGPICAKEQIVKDIEKFSSKIRNHTLKKIYKRILTRYT
ncbi:MAG: hypothetical protein JW840_05170 [Candidatus Thermoplasmatota archaeon]|nr:hypothetical protein [Candidatus Thermoplasmatota archaeon]